MTSLLATHSGGIISTTIPQPAPVVTAPDTRAPLTAGLPPWLTNIPFFALHVVCFAVFLTGVDALALVLCAACYLVRMFGITAGYHRYFAHRAFKTGRAFQFVLAWLGCSAMQKGPLWWASHHRHHHRHSDTRDDVHSPYEPNFWWSHLGWVLSGDYDQTDWNGVRDWEGSPEIHWLNRFHWIPGILLGALCFAIDGWAGLVWGFFVSTVLLYHATFTVNSLCHLFGRRRYATNDDSRNNAFVALITLGEGWHNNHHHYQSSANQGFFWWEIDISYYIICILSVFDITWDVRTPPRKRIAAQDEKQTHRRRKERKSTVRA